MIATISMNAGSWISTISHNTFHNACLFLNILPSPIIIDHKIFNLYGSIIALYFFITLVFDIFIYLKKLSDIQNY